MTTGQVWDLATLVFLQNSLPPHPQHSQGWDFFPLFFWWPWPVLQVSASTTLSWKPNLNLLSRVCQGSRDLHPVSGALPQFFTAAHLPMRPSMSSYMLGSQIRGCRLDSDGCFPTPCCLAPWKSRGSMHCNPITSSRWGKERRQEAGQETENKRLSNRLQQNREFHEGMLNLVALWQNAKLHSHL